MKHLKSILKPYDKKSKYVIISIDALRSEDLEFLKTLPNFSKLINNGSVVKKVTSIYPSVTYPCHATILTGCYPNKHGIYNNYLFQPGTEKPDWFWFYNYIKRKTLIDVAKEKNMKIATLFWPVTGGCKIKYNLAEILPHGKYKSQASVSLKYSSTLFMLKCFIKHGHNLKGISQPYLDNFTTECALDVLKNDVDLSLIHLVDLDSMRHSFGTNSKESYEALKRHDERLGRILSLLKDKNTLEDTTFFILGDHSFKDVEYMININAFLRDNNFINLSPDGELIEYTAYAHKCDGSCEIFVKDTLTKNRLLSLFNKTTLNTLGIKNVYTDDSLNSFNVGNNISIMLEAKDGFYFTNNYKSNVYVEKNDPSKGVAHHGYNPKEDDYKTLFFASGKGISKGLEIEHMNLVDIAPTFCKLINERIEGMDGKSIDELLL
ncbi:alkaline phosphatase family protein [Oceanirhabdus sp. W0125-5]|uniref:alkaline phosphatase family protein n=1 Tax=Oceanirhabdus sp. W0125-5 TaxID=2999116 RepID=UPI0022F2E6AB|nr:ectonucleotide pyrophosphatase/phosphodiesterase [Oceanirhabdus sp. W0125-5]WBW99339.1 ectonucleotide pyrophosphatase/phosphodiesterase [Oceanirhabdus sp. W0125-5]